jgi:hypothetical protein
VEHLKRSNPDIFLTTVAYPIKGTPYYSEVEDRLVSSKDWSTRTERDWIVKGRHSKRYYRFANRWIVGSVALYRQRMAPQHDLLAMAKAAANAGIGRVGMALTAAEVEA